MTEEQGDDKVKRKHRDRRKENTAYLEILGNLEEGWVRYG